MPDIIELVWNELTEEITDIKNEVSMLERRTERSETAGGVRSSTLALAPLAVNGAKGGDMLWISNARKSGEGAGLGTGIVCYYNPTTNSWFRFADDTAVVI